MRRLGLVVFVLLSCSPQSISVPDEWESQAVALTEVTGFGSNPGGLSLFIYEPSGVGSNVPLVLVLHGCWQTAAVSEGVGWNALADRHRFRVAYPQTADNNGCFEWFTGLQQTRTGPQVTSILQMVQHLTSTHGVAPTRVYVTGLSAGGAMGAVLLAVAPDVFSRGALIAAAPFACATTAFQSLGCTTTSTNRTAAQWGTLVRLAAGSKRAPRVSLWHGTSDLVVSPDNLQELVEQWTDVNAIDTTPELTTNVGAATRREFKDDAGLTLVESWSVAGLGHGYPVDPSRACGTASAFHLDVSLCASRHAADFFGLLQSSDAGPLDGGSVEDSDGGPLDAGVWDSGPSGSGGGGGVATGGGGGSAPVGCACGSGFEPGWLIVVAALLVLPLPLGRAARLLVGRRGDSPR